VESAERLRRDLTKARAEHPQAIAALGSWVRAGEPERCEAPAQTLFAGAALYEAHLGADGLKTARVARGRVEAVRGRDEAFIALGRRGELDPIRLARAGWDVIDLPHFKLLASRVDEGMTWLASSGGGRAGYRGRGNSEILVPYGPSTSAFGAPKFP